MLGMPHIKEMFYENRKTYTEKQGFDFMGANMTSYNLSRGAPIYWKNIPVLKEAFARHPDAQWEGLARNILLDHKVHGAGGGMSSFSTPASYKHDDISFIISQDSEGLNVGSFLMRRGDWSKWLLDLWTDPLYISQNWIFPEQDAWSICGSTTTSCGIMWRSQINTP
ncbi:hypothetical protein N7523_010644 [Penicillium sp. IBT 18751x]|nr:hypothetical protein N7523_010644 [Penicillium sp. IBT 18751x]